LSEADVRIFAWLVVSSAALSGFGPTGVMAGTDAANAAVAVKTTAITNAHTP
jgi:hypothetical protein